MPARGSLVSGFRVLRQLFLAVLEGLFLTLHIQVNRYLTNWGLPRSVVMLEGKNWKMEDGGWKKKGGR